MRQLNYVTARRSRAGLRYAKPMLDGSAVGPRSRLKANACPQARARLLVIAVALLLFGAPTAVADPVGQITEFSTGSSTTSGPQYIAPGTDGNLWFTEPYGQKIGRITPSGQITEFSAGLSPTSLPGWIAPGADGNMWFTDVSVVGASETSAVGRITPSGQITEYAAGLNANSAPVGIAPGPDGNVWFADEAGAVGWISPSGQISEFSAGLNPGSEPAGIAVGTDGNLWFTDLGATPAIGRITPSGQITEYSAGLKPGSQLAGIAAGPDGNLWFADAGSELGGTSAIGRITPSGQITEYSAGLSPDSVPVVIAPGPDGDMWFTDQTGAIGRIGTGAPPALQTPTSVSGANRQASPESCQAQWSDWAGYTARSGLYPFDGYMWLRDGSPIPGQTTPTYTPTGADVGHQLACRATVTYPLPFQLTATATSPAITIQAAPPPPSIPALSALNVSPRTFTLRGRRVGGRCEPATRSNRTHHTCARRVAFEIRLKLSESATVTLTIQRALPGREINGRCQSPTPKAHRHRGCTRLDTLPGASVVTGAAGANAFTLTAATGGHPLSPGSYRLLATPTTDGLAGNPLHTTFQITP
jgi:streptogramin lyase